MNFNKKYNYDKTAVTELNCDLITSQFIFKKIHAVIVHRSLRGSVRRLGVGSDAKKIIFFCSIFFLLKKTFFFFKLICLLKNIYYQVYLIM